MNKSVMALAVAGALAAPAALAQQVTVGGTFNILFYSHDADDKSGSSKSDVMESSESEILIRAEDKVGGGLSVWAQCASSADGVVGGVADTTGRVLCTRNSAVGFRGDFGNIFFGNWDTPMKLIQNAARGWFSGTNGLYGGSMIILANDSASGASNTGVSFYRRQANSANYQSPSWGGFTIAAAVSASNESQTIADSAGLTPRLMGLNAMYRGGPLLFGVGYEKHDDYAIDTTFGGLAVARNESATDDAFSLLAGVQFGGFNIRALYQANTFELGAGLGGGEVKQVGYGPYADWQIAGPHALHFGFAKSEDIEGPAGDLPATSADWMSVAYSYDVSKRTQLLFAFTQLKNDANANFSLGVQSSATTLGGKGKSIGAAIRHRF
jgi:predicted porin